MKDSTQATRNWRRGVLAVGGLLFVAIATILRLISNHPVVDSVGQILQGAGIAMFVAGAVSLGIEQLIRGSTIKEFEERTGELLDQTQEKLTARLIGFLKTYNDDLSKKIEELGTEIRGSNIKMIFSDREKGLAAMGIAIKEADSFVYIMGISLREFFQLERPCSRAIEGIYHSDKGIKFKILILNNRSAEALDRSSREANITFKDVDDPEYKSSTLFRETRATIRKIQDRYSKMELRVYDSASLFLLITDKVIFMEPYHYGERRVEEEGFVRIAERVPLIQFEKTADPRSRGPYEQFLGHFEYVFNRAKPPTDKHTSLEANGLHQ